MVNKVNHNPLDNLKNELCIFFGTGRIAQAFYEKYCKEKGIITRPAFWCDNDLDKQGTFLDGIEIISPDKLFSISEKYYRSGKKLAVVIAATGINLLQIICQFEQAALKARLYSAMQIDAIHYFQENDEKIRAINAMFADEKSRQIYMEMLENMKIGRCIDFSLAESNQYIDNDVIPVLSNKEIIVDAGVCRGEEIDKAIQMNSKVRVYAFEPDKQSMIQLKKKYKNNKNVILCEYALWNEKRSMSFASNELAPSASRINSNLQEEIANEIIAMPLEEVVKEKVSLIKMDIEGAEYNALLGAVNTIQMHKPKLAICVYHNIEDYVRIPLLIQALNSEYKFYFRQHSVTSGESVFYAV